MPVNDLNPNLLDETMLTNIRALLQQVADLLHQSNAAINLTSDERRRYGSINEQNKLLVNKVNDYTNNHPSLQSPDVDWPQYQKHLALRNNLAAIESALNQLTEICSDMRILYDYSLYQNALVDYDYTKYKANSTANGTGFRSKYDDIKQLFTSHAATKTTTDTTDKPATGQ
jgi:patatin-like phospholipase/acyl hydrolase